MLSEVFVAASDDAARAYLHTGAAVAGVEDVVETTELTSVEIDLLESVLTGRPLRDVVREEGGGVLAYAGDQGPWVMDVHLELTDALVALAGEPGERVAAAAAAWGKHTELAEADPDDVLALLEELVGLAVTAREQGGELYLWNALEPDVSG
ncbi:MAG TPA: hypothetical protein VLJ59_18125 [Mycobacteriales bacterium]|nr:hypothetical protein [Mycobacteriales bacterium]